MIEIISQNNEQQSKDVENNLKFLDDESLKKLIEETYQGIIEDAKDVEGFNNLLYQEVTRKVLGEEYSQDDKDVRDLGGELANIRTRLKQMVSGFLAEIRGIETSGKSPVGEIEAEVPLPNNQTIENYLSRQEIESGAKDFLRKMLDSSNEFKNVFEKKLSEGCLGALNEVIELVKRSDNIFSTESLERISELKRNPEFSNIEGRRVEIMTALATPLLQEHISYKDLGALLSSGIEISAVSRENGNQGYDGAMWYDPDKCQIIILEKTLKDDGKNENGIEFKRDINHLINHEIAHGVVERTIKESDEDLYEILEDDIERCPKSFRIAVEMLEKANANPALLEFQPIQVKTACEAYQKMVSKIESDKSLTDEQKKDKTMRQKIDKANEILTDYTAIFLRSDGSLGDFMGIAMATADQRALNQYLERQSAGDADQSVSEMLQSFRKASVERIESNNISNFKEAVAILSENPKLQEVVKTFSAFYEPIKSTIGEKKLFNNISEMSRRNRFGDNFEDESYFSGGLYHEPENGIPTGQKDVHSLAKDATDALKTVGEEITKLIFAGKV